MLIEAADPESYAEITSNFAYWSDIENHYGGEVVRSTGHGFCGIGRKKLLILLQDRARALGFVAESNFEQIIRTYIEDDLPDR